MYRIDDEDTYYMLLPPNMQDTDARCFSYALSKQLKKFVRLAGQLNVWGNLKGLNQKYYDLIASCMNAQYYRTGYADKTKLELIEHAYEMHRFAGTQTAIDALLNIVFENAQFIPWHRYDGNPYHFKVLVYDLLEEDATELFTDVLKKVKAARSILDTIDIGREASQSMHFAAVTTYSSKGAKITEDVNDANEIRHRSCTGATVTGHSVGMKIVEKWGTEENETQANEHLAGATAGSVKAPCIIEDNNQQASPITAARYTGATTTNNQKSPAITEDHNQSNATTQVTHAASATSATYNNAIS